MSIRNSAYDMKYFNSGEIDLRFEREDRFAGF